ncbi:hypothetical protein IKP94_00940 [Candidatus Saccharibacteria bacterium]|nr:hypothetical protein [Candidatus Saccharibacteria bacterium]MBR6964887.1 hypothetical protein [Candidatus Saccharibacteria bacterium]
MPKKISSNKKNNKLLCWQIATIICAVLAVIGFALVAKFTIFSAESDNEETAFTELEKSIRDEYGSNDKYELELKFYKKGTTKDGKYFYAIINHGLVGVDGAWGTDVYFRSVIKNSEWKSWNVFNDAINLPVCSKLDKELVDFIENYSYIDEEYIFCE